MSGITSRFQVHASTTPERPALVFERDRLLWGDLVPILDRIGAWIAGRAPPGGAIALHQPNSPGLALLFLAAARSGRVAQVLDPDWPLETARAVLGGLAPALTVTADRFLVGPNAIVLDPQLPFGAVADALGAPSRPGLKAEPAPDGSFYVGFTSGSTGHPKGYRRSHGSWVESFRADAAEFGIGGDDVVLAPGSLTHSLFLYALANGLHVGATVVFCRGFRPNRVLRLLRAQGVTVVYGVPTQMRLVLEAGAGERPFDSVRWVLSSGAKWFSDTMPDVRRLFPGARFAEFYGASELSFVTVARDDEPVPQASVGRAFPGVEISVRDRRGRRMAQGRIGLVFVASPLLFSGYALAGEDDLLRAGEAISVGDLGFLDESGYLHLVGRAKRMIVTSGKNLYPEEIERVLERHPAVEAAAVLGAPDARRGERIVALLSLRPGPRPSRAALIASARAALPLYKVPRRYGFVAEWPRTRSEKSDFAALRGLWQSGDYEVLV